MEYYERNEEALNAERDRDKATAEEGSSVFSNFYNLKNGRTVLRVLPSWSPEGVWFRKIREYYFQMGEQHLFLTSPLDFDLPDPLDEYNNEVFQIGTDAAKTEAKRFRYKERFLVNALVVSDNQGTTVADGIKIVKLPKTVKISLVDLDTDSEYGDITNPEQGFNIIIDRSGKGLSTEYSVKAQRERTNIFDLLTNSGINPQGMSMFNLDEVHSTGLKSYDELKAILEQLKGDFTEGSTFAQKMPAFPVRGVERTASPTMPTKTITTPEGSTVEIPVVPMAPHQGGN
ncbi:MAG: hypothetical protein SVK08_00990 [Halobacteriota archaeon]|nr:hypothetical protein [Halobacteriota archaeon]